MAQRFQVTVLGGGFPSTPASLQYRLANDPSGQEIARYQKVHLFDVNLPDGNTYRESSTVMAGTQLPQVYPSSDLYSGTVCVLRCFPNFTGT